MLGSGPIRAHGVLGGTTSWERGLPARARRGIRGGLRGQGCPRSQQAIWPNGGEMNLVRNQDRERDAIQGLAMSGVFGHRVEFGFGTASRGTEPCGPGHPSVGRCTSRRDTAWSGPGLGPVPDGASIASDRRADLEPPKPKVRAARRGSECSTEPASAGGRLVAAPRVEVEAGPAGVDSCHAPSRAAGLPASLALQPEHRGRSATGVDAGSRAAIPPAGRARDAAGRKSTPQRWRETAGLRIVRAPNWLTLQAKGCTFARRVTFVWRPL